ncbi:alanine dehydrogenase [Ruminococcus gauvreauii]|uniref:Alanine dehydrogenase n=1 Tax=Ruminococcus gauvreauii TaxID=438033 RepID=A0ABY5VEP5_9FIRM|nr:alanine dehydrogenase [Ruminococcus gauvreauii]UWP57918.1 alanine dehydrogenase [Ruminococcus gauvreauii]
MIVGLVKEIKNNEFRVGLTPNCVKAYVQDGNQVIVETNAGTGSGFTDEEYIAAGANIYPDAASVWNSAQMIVKVKEPISSEYQYLRKDLILYTYLHLAADAPLTEALLKNEVKSIAYETIVGPKGGLPCLQPMSEIAGRLSIQEGAKYLEKTFGGCGVLLSGVPGVKKGKIVILGGGNVGTNACKIAVGMGADVSILDVSASRLAYLDDIFGSRVQTLYSTGPNIQAELADADLVIGAVLLPGRAAPKLVKKEDLKMMKKGAVVVDVAVDQGGCIETTHATTHEDPIFEVDGIVHYCVANMPGAVPRTSTLALTSTTLGHGLSIARNGFEKAALLDAGLYQGVNTYAGRCTYAGVAEALNLDFTEAREIMDNASYTSLKVS